MLSFLSSISFHHSAQPQTHSTFPLYKTRILTAIRENSSNRVCADCGRPDPEWAVVNWGLVVCKDCSGVHRDLGVSYSKVRSLKMDEDIWTDDVVLFMQKFGKGWWVIYENSCE